MSVATKDIRNVALLGHSGSGKTTFAECMLYETKAISRIGSIDEGNTTSDYTNIEKEKGNSIFTSLMHANWRGCKINILDTPGSNDFVGEILSGLKVADTAVMMINANGGVEVGTEIIWDYIQDFNTPTMFVVNHLDNEKSNFEASLDQLKGRFGNKVMAFQYPLNEGSGFNKIIDALRMVMYVFPEGGGKPVKEDIPDAEMARAQELHNAMVEAAAEEDEPLMEKFFDQGFLTEEELTQGLTMALVNHDIFPVFCASAKLNMGSGRIMGFLMDIAPSPADRPDVLLENGEHVNIDPNGDPVMFVYKTMSEPQVGTVSYFKVYSGSVHSGLELINNTNLHHERVSQIYVSEGKNRQLVDAINAGDLGSTVKLKFTHTNNTLSPKGREVKIDPIHFPSSLIRAAITPPNSNDMEKMMKALHQLSEEDPTIVLEQNAQLKQIILHGQGQLHLDITKYRMERVHNVSMNFEAPRIMFMETITSSGDGHYRHKKQSGGSGQFGEVHMTIEQYYDGMPEPKDLKVRSHTIEDLPWGGKLAFYWCIVGGSIDAKYSNAIKKGVMQKMENGPLTGSFCRDIRVCIYDGKMHPVDSNDMAFMLAGSHIFKTIFKEAKPQVLEPIHDVEILCTDDAMGDIMSDLQTRRAMIMGMEGDGHYQKILAKVPLSEMYQYASTLKSISQGRAKFTRKFAEYTAMPNDLQKKLIADYQAAEEAH